MMTKTGMKVAQDYIYLQLQTLKTTGNIKSQDIMIVAGTVVDYAPTCVILVISKQKVWREIYPDVLYMDNLETSLTTTVDNDCENTGRVIVQS